MNRIAPAMLIPQTVRGTMETAAMGKAVVTAKIENLEDLYGVRSNRLTAEQVRFVEVLDTLVETGATNLSLPGSLIAQLGLYPMRSRPARTSAGPRMVQVFSAVRLTIQGRDCVCDVAEVPDDCPVLIGQVPLELLDFVVDPASQRLIGNPAHGGEHMLEMY
jgi:predicted aspartyl protease